MTLLAIVQSNTTLQAADVEGGLRDVERPRRAREIEVLREDDEGVQAIEVQHVSMDGRRVRADKAGRGSYNFWL